MSTTTAVAIVESGPRARLSAITAIVTVGETPIEQRRRQRRRRRRAPRRPAPAPIGSQRPERRTARPRQARHATAIVDDADRTPSRRAADREARGVAGEGPAMNAMTTIAKPLAALKVARHRLA